VDERPPRRHGRRSGIDHVPQRMAGRRRLRRLRSRDRRLEVKCPKAPAAEGRIPTALWSLVQRGSRQCRLVRAEGHRPAKSARGLEVRRDEHGNGFALPARTADEAHAGPQDRGRGDRSGGERGPARENASNQIEAAGPPTAWLVDEQGSEGAEDALYLRRGNRAFPSPRPTRSRSRAGPATWWRSAGSRECSP
jgi:hypothetical protein